MGQARPGGRFRDKSVIEEFKDLGGDARLLERLLRHPALKVLERLDNEESARASMADRFADANERLGQAADAIGEIAAWAAATDALRSKVPAWLEDIRVSTQEINRIKLGLEVERARYDGVRRKGLFMIHAERYFFLACLIPYTAFLNHRRGKTPSPNWEWIERWVKKIAKEREEKELHLRGWWAKEVLRRKSWPSQSLLYALAAGAAVHLEENKGRKRADWITEWQRPNLPAHFEAHPIPIKRRPSAVDAAYLEGVSKYVPLARKNLSRLYPHIKALAATQPADPLDGLVQERVAARIGKLSTRMRIRLAQARDERLNTKALLKGHLAKQSLQGAPEYRRWLKRVTRQQPKSRPAR